MQHVIHDKRYRFVFLGYLWRVARAVHNSASAHLVSVGIEPQRTHSPEAIQFCVQHRIPWFDARGIRQSDRFKALLLDGIDLLVVGAFGQILDASILGAPRCGGLNVHPSLLPSYRGGSSIQEQIIAGEQRGGVTLHWMTAEVDGGPIAAAQEVGITPDDDYLTVLTRCVDAAEMLMGKLLESPVESWPRLEQPTGPPPLPQRSSKHGIINWGSDAKSIRRLVLADGWRGWVRSESPEGDLIVNQVNIATEGIWDGVAPGTILALTPEPIVATGRGAIRLIKWQSTAPLRCGQLLPSLPRSAP